MSTTASKLRHWTNPTFAHCHICKGNTNQVEQHEVRDGIHRVERTCYGCGQWTWRETRRA